MLLSILANLVGIYSLINIPLPSDSIINLNNNNLNYIERVYQSGPIKNNNTSLGLEVRATSVIIVDKESNKVLWQKNSDEVESIASITKLMTALVFLENNPGWETEVKINTTDYRDGGRRRIYTGEVIKVKDIFNTALIASENNAISALVRSTGLSEEDFVKRMNERAMYLGMSKTVFSDPTGLNPNNKSTVEDLAKLIKIAFSRDEISNITSSKEYEFEVVNTGKKYVMENTNQLLDSYLNIRAGKTGYLEEAGHCLTSMIRGNNNKEIYIVVLGSDSQYNRFQEVKALTTWTFNNYIWP